jgi:hypothetical protein
MLLMLLKRSIPKTYIHAVMQAGMIKVSTVTVASRQCLKACCRNKQKRTVAIFARHKPDRSSAA